MLNKSFATGILSSTKSGIKLYPVPSYRRIGAFIRDWGKDDTFSWYGEQGVLNFEKSVRNRLACLKLYRWLYGNPRKLRG